MTERPWPTLTEIICPAAVLLRVQWIREALAPVFRRVGGWL